ncbi:complex I intermediate-associated protein 30-domain-containing protein [Peziza echinospora]|nr:complex I intermediate-associated protein 30-domain-containing protein [Peziza echinospora]
MRPSLVLRATGGFWKKSLDEMKRATTRAVTMEGVTGKFSDLPLATFHTPADLTETKLICDSDDSGFSSASLTFVPATPTDPPHALFKGHISLDLPPNRPDIQRSGYAAFRTIEPGWSIWGKQFWDIDPYTYLALRVKSDGSRYHVNLQTDGIVPTDIHQHRLVTERNGEWEDVYIPFHDFVRTNHGQVVRPRDLLRSKVRTVGIGLIDRVPGPFELAIEKIWVRAGFFLSFHSISFIVPWKN